MVISGMIPAMCSQKRTNRPMTPRQAMLGVVRRLHDAGYEALLAGGCVRDVLLGRRPHDYDVATNATPATVADLFPRSLTVGVRFGVVIVRMGGRAVEVATFRSETGYADGRRPDRVVFTDARQDALRRDFTINGMFLDPLRDEVIDYVGGREDLQKGIIRAIGRPQERFSEDHLRMLRAIRFAARLGFTIDAATWRAMCEHANKLGRISAERIGMELEYILTDPGRGRGGQLLLEAGLAGAIFPHVEIGRLQSGLKVLEKWPRRIGFGPALAAMLCYVEPEKVSRACRYLKTSNDIRHQAIWLVEHQEQLLRSIPLSKGPLKKWLAQPLFEILVTLLRCRLHAENRSLAVLRQLRRQIRDLGDEPIAPPPLLDGHDLMKLGCPAGPRLGRLMEELYLAQLENHITTRPQAQQWAQTWLRRHCEKYPNGKL